MKNSLLQYVFLLLALFSGFRSVAGSTLPDSCKLEFGTNVSEITDYGTEQPFVDLMHNCREWYSKNQASGGPFNTNAADSMSYRTDGYPDSIPQQVLNHPPQIVATVWGNTDGWPAGNYSVLYSGSGHLSFTGVTNVVQVNPNKITFDLLNPIGGTVQMIIDSSFSGDPIRAIHVIIPGHEATYQTDIFNPVWLNLIKKFSTIRFMDWGNTNGWGQPDSYTWDDTTRFSWSDRAKTDYYTWTTMKGVPYEIMIQLMNEQNKDGWICVPHRANNNYIQNMASLFKSTVHPELKVYVEYSNEIWNWGFGQTNWLNKYGCVVPSHIWPEGIVPYIQNCLNQWTTVYAGSLERIVRVVGVQEGWQDVSNRIVFNMTPGSFDAFSPAYYFALSDTADAHLDVLGSAATIADVALNARQGREIFEKVWLMSQKASIADSLHIPMIFYEGGQHLTPHPFGTNPSYSQSLLDLQRDTSMYNMYMEWFDFLRTLQSNSTPLLCMNYTLVKPRSAANGSWGILESMYQDTAVIKAPKFKAVMESIHDCSSPSAVAFKDIVFETHVYPNPFSSSITIHSNEFESGTLELYDVLGRKCFSKVVESKNEVVYPSLLPGVYFWKVITNQNKEIYGNLLVKME